MRLSMILILSNFPHPIHSVIYHSIYLDTSNTNRCFVSASSFDIGCQETIESQDYL